MLYQLKLALTLPRIEGESLDDFKTRILLDSKDQGQKAAQLGTAIHASLDKAYSGKEYDPDHAEYVKAVQEAIFLRYGDQDWMAEKSFTHPLGFGGKIKEREGRKERREERESRKKRLCCTQRNEIPSDQ